MSCAFNILKCHFYTSTAFGTQYGRFMKKVLKENKNKRKWQIGDKYTSPDYPTATNLSRGATEGKKSANSKRVIVLNKLFMRYLTDLMATGANSAAFLGRGLEINRVMVTPDFKGVNVFWIAKGTENDLQIEEMLGHHAGALRHELSQLKVMGVVPKINFLKDKAYAKLMEVDLRLAKADFGEDYVSVDPSYRFKSELNLKATLPDSVKERIAALEANDADEREDAPPMRSDVLGLNHSEIMLKIEKAMKKSQAVHRKAGAFEKLLPVTTNVEPVEYQSHAEQKAAFQQFLIKRQILRAKAKKDDKYNPEYEYFRTESIEYFRDSPFVDELNECPPMRDTDYIEEEDNNN